jgi:hypothetical protein
MLYICTVNQQQTYIKPMKIPNKTLQKWKNLKEEGDIALLAGLTGKAESTIHQILRTGVAKIEDAEKIKGFYMNRKRRVAKIEQDQD